MTDTVSMDLLVCVGYLDSQLGPLDGACKDKGPHGCKSERCRVCDGHMLFPEVSVQSARDNCRELHLWDGGSA